MFSSHALYVTFALYTTCVCQLRVGDEGVCVKIKNYQVRTNRGRTIDKQLRKVMCCEDWKFDFASKKCVFYCRLGCDRGRCIGPNECSCDPPYRLVEGKCAEPVCEPACVNGKCVGNDTCLCDPGHEVLNRTHCAPKCSPGYERPCSNGTCEPDTDPFGCVPKCEPECGNGTCVAPGVCRCREGYEAESSWNCEPVCEACDNGRCVAPDVCECLPGYTKNASGACAPVCEACDNGKCTAPNVCTCSAGYATENGDGAYKKCVPVCTESCVNGHCKSPDLCACNAGYIRSNESASVCHKGCDGPCENGVCTASGYCECNHDFEFENGTCVRISKEPANCENCGGNCTEGACLCADDSNCLSPSNVESAEVASSARLAGLELSWVVGGAVGLLLLILVIAVIGHMWRRRNEYNAKSTDDKGNTYGSVVYTVPNTLLNIGDEVRDRSDNDYDVVTDPDPSRAAGESLLGDANARDERMY